jgi:DNA mismatch repair ATPase MutS
VLVDELGKGTEAVSGTALSGAMLEMLDAGLAYLVFATHLHLLLKLPLEVEHMARWRMVVEEQPGRGRCM